MKRFSLKPDIEIFPFAADFSAAFPTTERDLIFISRHVYHDYFDGKFPDATIVFHTDYGQGEPTDQLVEAMLADLPLEKFDRVFAIGGGTILDVGKLLALEKARPVLDLFLKKFPAKKTRELILVPTTCGTGSEVTNVSILGFVEQKTKFGLAVDSLYADHAVLIPELLEHLPFGVFATSSIDAFIHAIESYVSPKATPFSELYSKTAMQTILSGYQMIVGSGKEIVPKLSKNFLIASCYGGIAFGNAGTGPVHAMSYPLSGAYHVAHGEANYVFFTKIFQLYQELKPAGKIQNLNFFLSQNLGCQSGQVYEKLEALFNQIIPKNSLSYYGVQPEDLPEFAHNVVEKQTRLMANTYMPFSYEQILEVYQALY